MTSTSVSRLGLSPQSGVKAPCVTASVMSGLVRQGLYTLNGVALQANDRVLDKDAVPARDRGIYVVTSGVWRRAKDWNANDDVLTGVLIPVPGIVYQVTFAGDFNINVTEPSFTLVVELNPNLRTDLLAPDGSDIVGFIQAGTGAVPRTSLEKMREWVSVKDFEAVGDGVTDDTAAIQVALNSGAMLVRATAARYLLTSPVTIPAGVKLLCDFAGHESPYKDLTATGDSFKGTTFVMRGTAQFLLSDNAAFEGAVLWYDQQNYNLQYDAGQPDGIEPWTVYPPVFQYIGSYSTVSVEDVVILGATHFFKSPEDKQLEKAHFSRIYGFPLMVGFDIGLTTDMLWIDNVHWNPNSMFQLPNYTPSEEKSAKYVRSMVPFRLGRVDGGYMTDCFVYACRDFLHLAYSATYAGGVGGSIRMTNCAADICHNFIRVEQTQRGFGISAVNCWAVNNVNTIYDESSGSVVSRNPAMVRFGNDAGAALENAHIELVAVKRGPGRAIAGIPGTGTPQNLFYFGSTSPDLSITCSACNFDEVNSSVVVGSDLEDGQRRYVALSNCSVRGAQNESLVYYDTVYASQNNSYSAFFEAKTGYMAIGNENPQFSRRARDFAEPNFMGFEGLYKDSGGDQKVFSAYRETGGGAVKERLLEVDRGTGDVVLGASSYSQNRFRFGAYYLWVDGSGRLRIKSSAPASDVDGTIVGTQS